MTQGESGVGVGRLGWVRFGRVGFGWVGLVGQSEDCPVTPGGPCMLSIAQGV